MTISTEWCSEPITVTVNGHELSVLTCLDHDMAVAVLAARLPDLYVARVMLAQLAKRNGKKDTAQYLRKKLPVDARLRSGDMGEILGTAYLAEHRGYEVGPSRLIVRDHEAMAMRGDDVLGARLSDGGDLHLVKGEAKSAAKASASPVAAARGALDASDGLPTPHSLSQFNERLLQAGHDQLSDAILDAQLAEDIRHEQVTHLLFVFSGEDACEHLRADLEAYAGPVAQHSVNLQASNHQRLIRDAFESAVSDGT